ncbi:hypothetical protein [Olleya aquimaris]|uniref:Uncharacterized protein n=1 Tax=Olleya aquimaris TaxID=639310 RepID=A0A327RRM7_9FLAO|nr:hypothetical protein [Olleya aquimaris]RAJ16377.1 hypothetical protein LY08_01237 [Olleya aquimaris]
MKTILQFALCLLIVQFSYAQTTLTDYFIINQDRIEVEISKSDGKYKIKLSKGEKEEEFNIGSTVGSFFDFKKQFRNLVYVGLLEKSMTESDDDYDADALKRIDQEAESIYYSFANNLRVLDNLDYKPNTGILKVNDRIPVYLDSDDFKELIKEYKNEASLKFQEKVKQIDFLIKIKPQNYQDSIIKIAQEIRIDKYQLIADDNLEEEEKYIKFNEYTSSLLQNNETYKALKDKYLSNLFPQYIPEKNDVVLTFLVIDNVEFEFSKGFLEIIKVIGHLDCDADNNSYNCNLIPSFLKNNAKMIFTNLYGIGFTSRENYKKLLNVGLRLNQVDKQFKVGDFDRLTRDNEIYNANLKSRIKIFMDDLINYDFYPNKLTRDFSPMDQKASVNGGDKLTLTKEESRKILEMEVYSDFQGFDAESPNGLIQMELSKHFNINTERKDAYRYLNWLFSGYGLFQYIEASGGITKIEDKERRLHPERIDNEITLEDNTVVLDAKRYTTPIDLLNYRTWNVGQNINFILIDNPDLKHQFHINGGLKFNRTAIQDSIKSIGSDNLKPTEYSVSYWTFYPEIKMHLLPEERYGFYAMWRPKYVHLISDKLEFKSKANPVDGYRRKISNWVNEFEFKGYVDVGNKGQIFLRWRLNHEMGYSANNYSQIQLGYSFFIFGKNESKSNSK